MKLDESSYSCQLMLARKQVWSNCVARKRLTIDYYKCAAHDYECLQGAAQYKQRELINASLRPIPKEM